MNLLYNVGFVYKAVVDKNRSNKIIPTALRAVILILNKRKKGKKKSIFDKGIKLIKNKRVNYISRLLVLLVQTTYQDQQDSEAAFGTSDAGIQPPRQ